MNRRSFLASLMALPGLRRWKKPEPPVIQYDPEATLKYYIAQIRLSQLHPPSGCIITNIRPPEGE